MPQNPKHLKGKINLNNKKHFSVQQKKSMNRLKRRPTRKKYFHTSNREWASISKTQRLLVNYETK